jgi:hypothetical protein
VSTVPNAFGVGLGSPMSAMALSAINLPFGQFNKPGGCVAAYVRSTGRQDLDDLHVSGNLVQSINDGLKRCRSGQNDVVFVLPGHTESISGADGWPNLVAGAQIISCGLPGSTSNPTLTWTAVASSLLLDVADVTVCGFNMVLTGIADVATPADISANGVTVALNHVTFNNGTLGAERFCQVTTTGGTNFRFIGNRVVAVGETAPATGAVVGISAAAAGFTVVGNVIEAANPGTATVGLINVAAACPNLLIKDNFLVQLESDAGADFAISIGNQASTGVVVGNMIKLSHDTALGQGISAGAAANAVLYAENYAAGADHVSGTLTPVADT